ncbi:MAG: D-glycero-alpha-D-manno-heptose-1,7-bisphosphate 7-phosphatase [bacterium]
MNKALLLDRDGVINKEINYLFKTEDVEFLPGIFETCRLFQDRGFLLIVVTNQAGIGRGYYTEEDFWRLTHWMDDEFKKRSVKIAKTYFCPFHPTAGVGDYKKISFDRKPNPGMILKARDEFQLNLQESILVGDNESDIEAGINAGVGTNVLIATEYDSSTHTQADLIINSLQDLPRALDIK